jgi:hypothetical protein
MKKRKLTKDKEHKMAQAIQGQRGDLSAWSEKPARASTGKAGGVIFSIRFSAEELDHLKNQAKIQGTTLSGFIRRAALEYGLNQTPRFEFTGAVSDNIALENGIYVASDWPFRSAQVGSFVIKYDDIHDLSGVLVPEDLIRNNVPTFSKREKETDDQKAV